MMTNKACSRTISHCTQALSHTCAWATWNCHVQHPPELLQACCRQRCQLTHAVDVLQACEGVLLSSGHMLSGSVGHFMDHHTSSILSSRLLTAAASNRLLTGSLLMGSVRLLMGSARLLMGSASLLMGSVDLLMGSVSLLMGSVRLLIGSLA